MSQGPRYEIKDLIAAGGMAEVYRGESAGIEGFRKKVAIKRVLPKLSANQEFINMFLDEARLCAYLNHSKCVQVFDIGQGAGTHFIVMEYVDGADLKGVQDTLMRHGQAMRNEVACLIALQICEGLAYAHSACDHYGAPLEIVHRDISPHNVLMTSHGEVKLVDFGLARASSHLTEEDEDIVKGKFGYLAPEITLRKGVDHRVDIFAAGILLWEMLAGRRLFLGESDLETFKQVQAAQIPDLRDMRNDISENLWRVIRKALWRDRNHRYQTADEFARDLAIVLFQAGNPVTYQDIAAVVRSAAQERTKTQKPEPADNEGVIGELILDTLHAFSGADEMDVPAQPVPAAAKGTPGYEDPTAWGLDAMLISSAPPAPSERATVAANAKAPPLPPPPRSPSHSPPSRRPRHRAPPPVPNSAPSNTVTSNGSQSGSSRDGPWWRRWFD